MSVSLFDGDGEPVELYYMTGAGPIPPRQVTWAGAVDPDPDPDPVPPGMFRDVGHMLATPGFTWAHRGGGIYKPEQSMAAYDYSVSRGYAVLEVSFGRTSDGVWFGLHDADMNRTSATTGLPPAMDMTWAQVQQYQIEIGQTDAPQPYMRWEELRDKYGETHLFVMDPKYPVLSSGAYRTEFLGMMHEIGTDRAIFKFSGDATWLADIYTSQGFHAWGYYYQADYENSSLANTQSAWTILGMDYTATQAAWDAAVGYGKKVVGHIAPDQAAYDMAIAKGASGVQCSGTHVIQAVAAPIEPEPDLHP